MILLLVVIMFNLQDSAAHPDLQSNENDLVQSRLYECITEKKCSKTDTKKKMDPNCQPDPNQSWWGKFFIGNVKYECLTGESGTTSKTETEGSTQVVTVKPEVTLTQVLTTQRTTVTIENKQVVPSTTVQTLGTTELKTEITTEAHLKTSTTTPPITQLIMNLTFRQTTGAANTVPIIHSTTEFKNLDFLSPAPRTTPSATIEEYITMKRYVVPLRHRAINVTSTESSKHVLFEIRNTSSERNMWNKSWHEVTERSTSKLNSSEIATIKLNHSITKTLDNVTEDGKHLPPRNKQYQFSSFNRIAVRK